MLGLLKDPAAAGRLQALAAGRYIENDDATALRLARWLTVLANHSDAANEILEKAAFRRRRSGALTAERNRLDARRDPGSGGYAADPAVDARLRMFRGRLARLALIEELLDRPVPRGGAALDAALKTLCGPHGWYHNMPLPDGRCSFDVGHIKLNSPVASRDHNVFQLDLLRPHLPAFARRTVVDIGPADGYFGLTAAREGASVSMIEPDPLHCQRVRFFAKLFDVEDRVRLANTFLTDRHRTTLRQADICIASGLLYHLWPLRASVDLLLETGGALVLEYVSVDRDLLSPDEAEAGWRAGSPIPDRWLLRHLGERGWTVIEFPEWGAKIGREKPGGEARKMILCRRNGATG